MTDPINMQQHSMSNHYSTDKGRRSSCCSYCAHSPSSPSLNEFESQTLSLTPPLENVFFNDEQEQPFSCIYLLNLFLAPDMTRYLAETSISDDVYSLPVHLQSLICEARMEVLVSKQKNHPKENSAVKRLEKVREYINSVAHRDTATTISTLSELIRDEDEMSTILE